MQVATVHLFLDKIKVMIPVQTSNKGKNKEFMDKCSPYIGKMVIISKLEHLVATTSPTDGFSPIFSSKIAVEVDAQAFIIAPVSES